jgi:hypothetical protein
MSSRRIVKIISRTISPFRVFIALLLAVGIWLFFTFIPHETPEALGRGFAGKGGGCEQKWDCDNGCCSGGECADDCHPDEPPPPPYVKGVVNCSGPLNNGWCKDALSLRVDASDPGQSIIISASVNGAVCPAYVTPCLIDLSNPPLVPQGSGTITFAATLHRDHLPVDQWAINGTTLPQA